MATEKGCQVNDVAVVDGMSEWARANKRMSEYCTSEFTCKRIHVSLKVETERTTKNKCMYT